MAQPTMTILNILCGWIIFLHVAYADIVLDKSMELHTALLSNYANYLRPCVGCSEPLVINLTFHLTALNDLDELKGEMNTVGFLKATWIEDRMSWNPYDYAGVTSLLFTNTEIWVPPLMVGNPSFAISNMNAENAHVRVLYNGLVIWAPGDVFRTNCDYNIYKYPFDKQTCYIAFVPWSYTNNEIIIKAPDDYVETPFFKGNGEWELDNTATRSYTDNGLSVANFYLTFKRKSEFLIINVVLPIVFLGSLNCMTYIIPFQSGERVSYAITVLLSLAVFMTLVNDNIPKTSSPMSILCYYLISIFTGSVLVMISSILNMTMYYREKCRPISNFYRKLVRIAYPCTYFGNTGKEKNGNRKMKLNQVDIVEVIEIDSNGDYLVGKDIKKVVPEYENYPKEAPDNVKQEVTWKKVAHAIDRLCFIIFNVYFVAVSVGLLLVAITA